ncbi:MAG: threonine dehydratase [Verrucomicrobiota bacterium]
MPTLASLQSAAELVHSVIPPTPQIRWPLLCERVGAEVWVKHENHNSTGAFKVRGGIVYLEELVRQHPDVKGVVSATRGNHGQSIAFSVARKGLRCVIVVPHGNSVEKNAAMRAFGAELIEHGHDFQAAIEHAASLARNENLHFVPSYDEPLMRGVASYALELFQAVPDLDAAYVPIGLGSGICGMIAVRDALGLKTEIIGATAKEAPAYAASFLAGKPIAANVGKTIADGVACRVPDPRAVEIILRGAARLLSLEENEIHAAMRHYFTDAHNVAEGAGALALAALLKEQSSMKEKRVAVILTGGNVDRNIFVPVLGGND